MDKEILTDAQFKEMMDEAGEAKRDMILMFKDKDGNWRGAIMKEGNDLMLKARQYDPQTVLQLLLTHDGKPDTKTE